MNDKQIMRRALYALTYHTEQTRPIVISAESIAELRAALAQPVGLRPTFGAIGSRDVDVAAAQNAWDAAQQVQPAADALDILMHYRCTHFSDENGDGLGLLDALAAAFGDADVGRAREEVGLIADALADHSPIAQTTGCACKWTGEVYESRCELHEAWHVAIHEWAKRAKAAEANLAQSVQPAVRTCKYPACVENGAEGKCIDWPTGACPGPGK